MFWIIFRRPMLGVLDERRRFSCDWPHPFASLCKVVLHSWKKRPQSMFLPPSIFMGMLFCRFSIFILPNMADGANARELNFVFMSPQYTVIKMSRLAPYMDLLELWGLIGNGWFQPITVCYRLGECGPNCLQVINKLFLHGGGHPFMR